MKRDQQNCKKKDIRVQRKSNDIIKNTDLFIHSKIQNV